MELSDVAYMLLIPSYAPWPEDALLRKKDMRVTRVGNVTDMRQFDLSAHGTSLNCVVDGYKTPSTRRRWRRFQTPVFNVQFRIDDSVAPPAFITPHASTEARGRTRVSLLSGVH